MLVGRNQFANLAEAIEHDVCIPLVVQVLMAEAWGDQKMGKFDFGMAEDFCNEESMMMWCSMSGTGIAELTCGRLEE